MNVLFFALIVVSFVIILVSLLGFLGAKNWACSLLSHFRSQYVLAGIVLFVLLAVMNTTWAIIPLIAILLNLPLLQNRNSEGPRSDLEPQLRVMSANLLIFNFNYEKIAESVLASHADVVFLYELMEDTFEELKKRLPEYAVSYFDASPKNLGVAVFAKSQTARIHSEHFSNPKIATAVVTLPDLRGLAIAGYHTDAPMTPKKYAAMKEEIAGLAHFSETCTHPLVVVGDFNDTTPSPIFAPLFKSGLKDTRKAWAQNASWPLFLPRFMRLCLDYVLVKNGAHLVSRSFGKRTGSDHEPIVAEIAVK